MEMKFSSKILGFTRESMSSNLHSYKCSDTSELLTVGSNFHDNQISVALNQKEARRMQAMVTSAQIGRLELAQLYGFVCLAERSWTVPIDSEVLESEAAWAAPLECGSHALLLPRTVKN